MKKLLILSGKGGTGKTTTAAAFIKFAKAKAFADVDVDAPNLHIISDLQGIAQDFDYFGSDKAEINQDKCIQCGLCIEHCNFEAITQHGNMVEINEYACEGCGLCEYVCPQKAVSLNKDKAGTVSLFKEEQVFSTAKLKMGRGNSGKLVMEVKKTLLQNAPFAELAIIDGSPGIGCPVIASINGVDLVLIVVEPSISGISDMKRILKTADIFKTKSVVCVNKYDTNVEITEQIETFCQENNIGFMGKIPYDKKASWAINNAKSLADVDCPANIALKKVFDETMNCF